jgi:aminoglycoside/choline kinase family phosphotransferase
MKVGDVVQGYELIEKIDGHGSERQFFRCRKDNVVSVMVYDEDIEQHLTLQQHLFKRKVAVPEVYWFNIDEKVMVVEDLGSVSLYALRKDGSLRQDIYRTVIDELVRLQIDGRPDVPVQCRYDREHIRWEQEYFRDHFLIQYSGMSTEETAGLEEDFMALGSEVLKSMKSVDDFLMHRDFQSQNIYLKDDRIRFIDFQSARIGPLTYDLSALLRDAYVRIDRGTENELLAYYYQKVMQRGIRIAEKDFMRVYELTALQRNMQALGAFANLSLNKDKPHFRRFIPRGLELLKNGLKDTKFTRLDKAVSSIKQ